MVIKKFGNFPTPGTVRFQHAVDLSSPTVPPADAVPDGAAFQ